MKIPLEITYRNVPRNEPTDNLIQEKMAKLQEIHDRITSCRISIEQPQEFQNSGNPYRVRIDLRCPPGRELVVTREAGEGVMHDSLLTVVNDAFQAMRRQLLKIKDKEGGDVRPHTDGYDTAMVIRLFPEDGYGFVRTLTGDEVYFHRNSVLHDDFERLEIGTGVRIVTSDGLEGPQASTLQVVDKPGVSAARQEEPGA